MPGAQRPPVPVEPRRGPRRDMWARVKEAVMALPGHFASPGIHVSGIRATDVFTLGEALAASIEDQVVVALNRMRRIWDPDDKHSTLIFVRQPQTFPDVLLRNFANNKTILGIELKGWYILAKEGEPNFRFRVDPDACDVHDLLVIVPWHLSDVISGAPRLLQPLILSARYAAKYRNWWWRCHRQARGEVEIRRPRGAVKPYPEARDQVLDEAVDDKGGNFGRIARTGMTEVSQFVKNTLEEPIAGIPAKSWLQFFRIFRQRADPESVAAALEALQAQAGRQQPDEARQRAERIVAMVAKELSVGSD